ncbi:MAG: MarR family winged helix-turn-helix transcriptional regulator, partial [Chloroflexota bacterium]
MPHQVDYVYLTDVLARRCFVTPQTMNEIVVSLERRGLIERRPHPTRGRVIEAALTSRGRAVLTACHQAVQAIEARLVDGLDATERNRLAASPRPGAASRLSTRRRG